MPQDLKQIPKNSVDVFLATDDGSLIFDDNDNTYLVVKLADSLRNILIKIATLKKIIKS